MNCFNDLIELIRIKLAKRWVAKQRQQRQERHELFKEYFEKSSNF